MIEKNKEKPFGVYILTGLFVIGILGILYQTITTPSFRIAGIVLTPLWIYMAIGIFKGWNHARIVCILIIGVWFVLALSNVSVILFTDLAKELGHTNPEMVLVRSVFRVLLLPVVIFYLMQKDVRLYFKKTN